jgi:EAL domain-containing protein (putative c-di-GMP-specific phosphodiesterase class I)
MPPRPLQETLCRSTCVRLAIDDFGTGYSSLSRLVNLPVDSSRSTVVHHGVRHLPGLDRRLKAVPEGVETAQQAQWLRSVGCEPMQGFYFAKPMSMDHLIIWATVHIEDEDAPTWENTVHVDFEAGSLVG